MRQLVFIVIVLCAVSFAGCQRFASPNPSQDSATGTTRASADAGHAEKLVGKWYAVKSPPTEIEFAKTGAFEIGRNGKVEIRGRFRVENEKLILTHIDGTPIGHPATIKCLTADQLVLGGSVGDDIEYVRNLEEALTRIVADAVISLDGKYLAKSTGLNTSIYEVLTGKKLKELQRTGAANLAMSPDSQHLAVALGSELTLWDSVEGKPLVAWKGTNRWSFKMAFCGDGSLLAAADDKSLRVWELAKRKLLLTISLGYEVHSLALSRDGKLIAVGGAERKSEEPRHHEIRIWEVPSGKLHADLKGSE